MIKGSTLVGFDELVRRHGGDPGWLLASVDISDIYLRQPEMYLPFYNFMQLLELAAKETERPLFGAELGFHQGIGVFGAIAPSLVTSATIGDALERMLEHYMLQTTGAELELERGGSAATLSAVLTSPAPAGAVQIHGQLCAAGTAIMRGFAGPDWMPSEVHFPHRVPAAGDRPYRAAFGEGLRFDSPRAALVFDADILSLPLPEADPALHELIERELAQLALRFAEDLPLQVEATILNAMSTGMVTVGAVAKRLAMSPRSLQRHLTATGTTFQDVLDNTRRQTAEHYLASTRLSLTEVSGLLGFQALSNFTHAFQRWHQASPREWRQARSGA